jgi:hypothetical protein
VTAIAGSASSPPDALAGTRGPVAQLAREWVTIMAIAVVGSAVPSIVGLNLFGYTQLEFPRTVFTVFTLLHLALCLTSFDRPNEVLRLIITPFLAQPYQVCLGWDFEPGALSFMRILPYLVLIAAFSLAIARRRYRPAKSELALSALALLLSISGWIAGSIYSMVGMTVVLFIGVLLPAFGMYVGSIARSRPEMLQQFGAAIASGLFVLMLGFLASLVLAGAVVTSRGEGTLESAREVGDFNALIPYLIFCWPFAVCYLQRVNRFLLGLLFVMFIVVTFVGFSRTMMLLAPPLMVLSLPVAFPRLRAHVVVVTLFATVLAGWLILQYVLSLPAGQFFVKLWFARFDIDPLAPNFSLIDSVQTVMVGGEAWNERSQLRAEGFRVFLEHPFTGTGWATFPHVSRIQQETSHSLTADLLQQAGIFATALFWLVVFEAFSRIVFVARRPDAWPAAVRVFAFTLFVWMVAAHTVGAQLFKVGDTGFSVNALSGMLFVLYLRREVVAHLCARPARAA